MAKEQNRRRQRPL